MPSKKTLKTLSFKQSFNPAPVGNKNSWKDRLGADKKDLAVLKKKQKRK